MDALTQERINDALIRGTAYEDLPLDLREKIEAEELPPPKRACGSCSLCCVAPAIEANVITLPLTGPKPCGVRCEYSDPGGGCRVYDRRPEICQSYRCLWIDGFIPEDHWPESVGVAWCFQSATGHPLGMKGVLLMGHCLNIKDTVEDERNQRTIVRFLSNQPPLRAVAVTLRDRVHAVTFGITRIRNGGKSISVGSVMVDIRQDDPIRQDYLPETERPAPWKMDVDFE